MTPVSRSVSPAERLSTVHDGTGMFIASAPLPWRCGICHELIFPNEVHQHPALTTWITKERTDA